eukprot:CAMPEP_0206331770 /NCGR_PEP_ID=MMETSP0106_2-20121207/24421_1 /ASSEMBLY_ACC=CAM_ASM_000206 /TAXON_ID=81532 /ORGANISM="Acanthoeca-like sp., Strain 10tr" /LENGTH=181 /DNA_ID=CAMNT_0053764601 /DNA_START=202 /DNA_END=743 /DNA_ORIENTATION=+
MSTVLSPVGLVRQASRATSPRHWLLLRALCHTPAVPALRQTWEQALQKGSDKRSTESRSPLEAPAEPPGGCQHTAASPGTMTRLCRHPPPSHYLHRVHRHVGLGCWLGFRGKVTVPLSKGLSRLQVVTVQRGDRPLDRDYGCWLHQIHHGARPILLTRGPQGDRPLGSRIVATVVAQSARA